MLIESAGFDGAMPILSEETLSKVSSLFVANETEADQDFDADF